MSDRKIIAPAMPTFPTLCLDCMRENFIAQFSVVILTCGNVIATSKIHLYEEETFLLSFMGQFDPP